MRRSPRATASWLVVAALALTTAHTVATDLASLHTQAGRSGPLGSVVVARRFIAMGHVFATADLSTRRMFGADRPAGSFSALTNVVGHTAAVALVAGSPIVRDALAGSTGDARGVVQRGQRALWVPLEHAPARPTPGQVVDVLATLTGSTDPTITVARGAVVLDSSEPGDAGVLLLVTEDAAPRVAYALANGAVTLAVAPLESACCQPRP